MKDIDQASKVDAGHRTDSPHGNTVEVMHHRDLCGEVIAVETSRKSRRLCRELLFAVRAHVVMETVEDLLRLPASVVDDRPVCLFFYRDERRPAVGCITVDDEIGGLFRHRFSSVALMAGDCSSLSVRLLFGSIRLEGHLR